MLHSITASGAMACSISVLGRAARQDEQVRRVALALGRAILQQVRNTRSSRTDSYMALTAEALYAEKVTHAPVPPAVSPAPDQDPVVGTAIDYLDIGLRYPGLLRTLEALLYADEETDIPAISAAVLAHDAIGLNNAAKLIQGLPQVFDFAETGQSFSGKADFADALERLSGGMLMNQGAVAVVLVLATASERDFTQMMTGMAANDRGVPCDVRAMGVA